MNSSQHLPNFKTWTGVSLLIPSIGALLNGYTLLVILHFKSLRRPHYVLVAFVAANDFITNCVFCPLEVLRSYMVHTFSRAATKENCSFEAVGFSLTVVCSTLGQVQIAANRWMAVFVPNAFRRFVTIRSVLVVSVLGNFVFPALTSILCFSAGWMNGTIDRTFGDCDIEWQSKEMRLAMYISAFYVPRFIELLCYFLIILRIVLSPQSRKRDVLKKARGSLSAFTSSALTICFLCPSWVLYSSDILTNDLGAMLWVKRFITRTSFAFNVFVLGLLM